MYAVPVDVLRLFIWVWLVSLVCIIKLYLMLDLIKRLYEIVVAIALSTIAITHLYIISIQIAIMSIVKPCLHITMK